MTTLESHIRGRLENGERYFYPRVSIVGKEHHNKYRRCHICKGTPLYLVEVSGRYAQFACGKDFQKTFCRAIKEWRKAYAELKKELRGEVAGALSMFRRSGREKGKP